MKLPLITTLIAGLSFSALGADQAPAKPTPKTDAKAESAGSKDLKDEKDRVSYSIGLNMGSNLKRQSVEINTDTFMKGLKDALDGGKPLMTESEIQETMRSFQVALRAKQEEKRKADGEKNKVAGEAFLAENKKKEGVKTTESGLQYKIIKEGTGGSPKPADRVEVIYRGTLIDGTEFDSTAKHGGKPAQFGVTGVIPGWTEALQMMKTGSKWQLFIPSNLAYKDRGQGQTIGPNSTLIFDVELVSIKEPEPTIQPLPQQPVTSDIIKVPSKAELDKGAKIEVIKPDQLPKNNTVPKPPTPAPLPKK